MAITYDTIKKEIQCISEEVLNTSREVPSVFKTVKFGLIPTVLYFSFYFLCIFTEVFIKNIWLFIGFLSVFFWVFMSLFISGYMQMFSMLPKDAHERFEIVKIYRSKAKIYYIAWLSLIAISGLVSIFSIWNSIALAVLTVLSTAILAIAFNFDVSRYQLASLFGVAGAVKKAAEK
ncbi:hypothetical protein PUG46_15955 [Erwiniaceae bacterium L1_55_4]|nr:hypothetical protein [Erwiniaceae bacterium L1_55_4]